MLTNIKSILKWIAQYWYPEVSYERMSDFIDLWTSLIQKWYKANGGISLIKRLKAIRLITTRYICKQPLMVNSDRVSVTHEGFPTVLLPIKDLVDSGHPQALRFVLTILGVSRCFPFTGEMKTDSITNKFSGSIKTIDPMFIKIFVKDFTGHFNPLVERPKPSKCFLSMKAGPLGGPAILSSHLSAARFTGVNLWGLAGIGGDRFMEWVKELKMSHTFDWELFLSKVKGKLSPNFRWGNRKFIRINDPEAKVRVVGCYDYISQLALTPYSDWAFNSLRNNFPKDRTFTQDPVITDKEELESYHSLDLSAATDRFPIDLQVQLLAEIAGPAFASYWKNLMIAEPFVHQSFKGPKRSLKTELIKYEVGQPMGARSSWATFTLSHHLVVQYAAYQHDLYPFDKYILLGDDVVIYNDIVAKEYTSIIEKLGVEISKPKSHVSIDTYEFAKRWFNKGIEISPVPINGFVSNYTNPKLLYSQLLELIYKGRGPRSIVDSTRIMTHLISMLNQESESLRLMKPNSWLDWNKRSNTIKPLYGRNEIRYFTRAFEELRLVFRYSSEFHEEEIREYMAKCTSSNEYTIPSNPVSLKQEWIRAGSGVVNGMAMRVIKDLSTYYKRYKEAYITSCSHAFQQGHVEVGRHPLTYAVYGSVTRFHKMNKDMGYTTDLNKQLETITLLNLDKLQSQDRSSKELIFTFSTFASKLRRQLQSDPDLIIAKARSMQFGRSLFDIQLAMQREFPHLQE